MNDFARKRRHLLPVTRLFGHVVESTNDVAQQQFILQVHLIIVLGEQLVFRRLAVLAHHDDRRLKRCKRRQNEIQQDEGIRIEIGVAKDVDQHPHSHDGSKEKNERP